MFITHTHYTFTRSMLVLTSPPSSKRMWSFDIPKRAIHASVYLRNLDLGKNYTVPIPFPLDRPNDENLVKEAIIALNALGKINEFVNDPDGKVNCIQKACIDWDRYSYDNLVYNILKPDTEMVRIAESIVNG